MMSKNMMEKRWITKIALVSILGLFAATPVLTAAYTEQLTISSNTQNYNAYSAALAAGWDGVTPIDLTITISPGVVVGSASTGSYAFDTGSGYPIGSSITIVNNGYIVGAGGAGGTGGARLNFQCSGAAGGAGGPALHVGHNISLTNNGTIGGGGGGGGGGGAKCNIITKGNTSGGGGGGGAGSQPGSGGGSSYPYSLGSSGALTTGGAGGGTQPVCGGVGAGGSGGNLGVYGKSGTASYNNTCTVNSYGSPGGAAGTGVAVDASQCVIAAGSGSIVPTQTIPACALGTVAVSSNTSSSWTITGPATITGSGTSQSSPSQPAGTYTITWGNVSGYTAPATQSLTLSPDGTIYFNGTYIIIDPPTVIFSVSPENIPYNTSATLSWSSTNATSCTAGGAWSGVKATSGSANTGNLTSSKTYTLYCTGLGGNSATQSVTVNVDTTPPTVSITSPAVDLTIYENQDQQFVGEATDVDGTIVAYEWRVNNCTTGTILSSLLSFTRSFSVGTYNVYLRAQDNSGFWSTNCPFRSIEVIANNQIPGVCGSANGVPSQKKPTSNLCSTVGLPGPVVLPENISVLPENNPSLSWTWTCSGENGGASASCSSNTSCGDGVCRPSKGENPATCRADCRVKFFEF